MSAWLENKENLRQIFRDANLAQVAICTAPELGIGESEIISAYGRRNVLRLPGSRSSAEMDRRLPRRMSRRPFAPGVTFENIQARVASGATVQVVDDAAGTDVLLLAAVSPDGSANLQPGTRSPGTEDTIIGLVGSG
jgi:hypothetical protein